MQIRITRNTANTNATNIPFPVPPTSSASGQISPAIIMTTNAIPMSHAIEAASDMRNNFRRWIANTVPKHPMPSVAKMNAGNIPVVHPPAVKKESKNSAGASGNMHHPHTFNAQVILCTRRSSRFAIGDLYLMTDWGISGIFTLRHPSRTLRLNASVNFRVTGPTVPSPMLRLSILVTEITSAPVPVRKHSSAAYKS